MRIHSTAAVAGVTWTMEHYILPSTPSFEDAIDQSQRALDLMAGYSGPWTMVHVPSTTTAVWMANELTLPHSFFVRMATYMHEPVSPVIR